MVHAVPVGCTHGVQRVPADCRGSMDIDLKQLKELMRSLKQFDISELELEKNGERIKLARAPEGTTYVTSGLPQLASASVAPGPVPSAAPAAAVDDANTVYVTSPFVGTFYAAATPGGDAFVKVGSEIRPGQILCIVEAMKLMNEIESEVSGTILEVLRENGKAVEYGDRLFKVRKS
jgi:acetyl-CoA carboxylase biotin carboxyl carrier protein